ncbi:reverse transcriptase domain-containing protein [Tanacetum coccineum]
MTPVIVEEPEIPMADNRTMAQMLQEPTEGYEDAIVIPEINANFKLKHGLINLVQNKQFFGHDKDDPHANILVAKVSSNSSTPGISPDVAALTTEVSKLKKLNEDSAYRTNKKPKLPANVKASSRPPPSTIKAFQRPFSRINGQANDVVLRNMQNQGQGLQNQMTNLTKMLSKFITSNTASSSNSGTLPSQTVTNPSGMFNAESTTTSGKTCKGLRLTTHLAPTPIVSIPLKEPEQNPETSMDKVQKPSLESTAQVPPPENQDSIFIEIPKPKAKKTVQEPNSPEPNSYQPKLPYPERMKVRENDKPSAQHSRFLKMFKQLRLEIGLKDALVEMPKFNKWLSSLLRNKEKLEEIAITTVNAECSAIIMNKVPEKLEDPGKFLIPCTLQELDRTSALADSGASINLLPHSIYKQLGLEALTPTLDGGGGGGDRIHTSRPC